MFNHVLICLFIAIPRANCFLKESKEYFTYEDVKINITSGCRSLDRQQYYWQSINDENITQIIKLNCLSQEHSEEKYFPKCCPPNYAYHKKHHKCVLSNITSVHDVFNKENLLIRTDLFDCSIVLDHILTKDIASIVIDSNRSLNFNEKSYKLGNYCLDNHLDEEEFVIRTCEEIDVCRNDGVRCIKKCCPDGQYYKRVTCQPGHHFGLSLEESSRFLDRNEHFNAILKTEKCKRYLGTEKYKYHITEDGALVIRELGVWKRYELEDNYYCMEYVDLGSQQRHEILLCMMDSKRIDSRASVKGALMVASCICLLLTIIGYFILPDLKNLIGNIIITYCSCLFIAFVILASLQFRPDPGNLCDILAFAVAFTFLSSFAWMTVLSYEIWRVLGSMVTDYGHRSSGEKKRYIQYSIFGWFIPIIITGISLIDYMYHIYPIPIRITLGEARCVFENNRSKGMYGYVFQFAVPCGILLLINIITFAKTMIYIFRVKNEIQKMKVLDSNTKQKKWKTFVADREKTTMVIKISLLMGLNWIFELFSSIFLDFSTNPTLEIIETIFDGFNALQGVFIFCIFMLKKKILKSLLKILNIKMKNRRASVATCSTEVVMIPTSVRTGRSE